LPGTVSYINNEPVWVVYNTVLLGLTEPGGCTVNITPGYEMRTAEQTGDSPIDAIFTGVTATVDVTLSEIDNEDNWVVAFPHAEKQEDTSTPPSIRVAGNSTTATTPYVGQKATSIDAPLILRPQSEYTDVSTEETGDLVFPTAFCNNVGEIVFALKSGNTLPLTFTALFDPSATQGENLWYRGLLTEGDGTWAAA
jgi:hypothetical protein